MWGNDYHADTVRLTTESVLALSTPLYEQAVAPKHPAPRQARGGRGGTPRRGAGGGGNRNARRRRGRTSAPARRGTNPKNSR